jgi:hypothetical protein
MPLPYFENGLNAGEYRRRMNSLVDVANEALTPGGFQGPPGPQGERGLDGIKGDPGNYTGVTLSGVAENETDLPSATGKANGYAYGVEVGDNLEIRVVVNEEWKNYGPIHSAQDRNVDGTVFLSPSGDDDQDGRTFGKAVRTIEAARYYAGNLGPKTAILAYPGSYESKGHEDFPDGCSFIGLTGARKTKVIPAPADEDGEYKTKNVFRLGDACYVEGVSFEGFAVGNPGDPSLNMENPTEGFAIAFRPQALIRRVPYVHNIVAYRGQPPELITAPLDRKNGNPAIGPGGGVVIADRAQISEYSAFPNIMTWGATPSVPNSIAYLAKNGALINPVNAVCLWAHKHFMCLNGGQMILSGCSSQFGDYSLWSEGVTRSVRVEPSGGPVFADDISAGNIELNAQSLIDTLWLQIVNDWCGCASTPTATDEANTKKDLGYLLTALRYTLIYGDETPWSQFIRGLFDWKGDSVFTCGCIPSYVTWFESLRNQINLLIGPADTKIMITGLFQALLNTIQNPQYKLERSQLTAINHQWTLPLSGVTRMALPSVFKSAGRASRIKRSIVQRDGGRVRYSGQDDEGNAVFVGGLEVDAGSGELRGTPFTLGVNRIAKSTAIALGGEI